MGSHILSGHILRSRITAIVALGTAVLFAFCGSAQAQGDARNGRALARSWCTSCHLVEPSGLGSDTAPPFAIIANDAQRSPARLKRWLANPHPPMPNMRLSRNEIDDLVAYLESLKSKK
ncbi:MAG: c-type cytochrome [Alphaproteobacteria bacterium]